MARNNQVSNEKALNHKVLLWYLRFSSKANKEIALKLKVLQKVYKLKLKVLLMGGRKMKFKIFKHNHKVALASETHLINV